MPSTWDDMMNDKSNWNYFTEQEVRNLDREFVALLDMARHRAKVPFVITSGYRTREHNFAVGGVDGSSHVTFPCVACDLMCRTSQDLWHILDGLFSVGLKRIGIYFTEVNGVPVITHVHVDADLTKPQEVVFLKWEGKPNQVVT